MSALDSLPAGWKLTALALAGTALFFVSSMSVMVALAGGVMVLDALAGLSPHTLWEQLRPAALIIALVFIAQGLIVGWEAAIVVALRLGTLIALAALVTLTTRVTDMMAALERALSPLSRVGVDPARVSLALSLAIRFIPVIATITHEVREAQQARGQGRNILALALPVIVRTLKMADEIADAIDARGG